MSDQPPPPPPPPQGLPPAAEPKPTWWKRKLWKLPAWGWIAIVIGLIATGAAGGSGGKKDDNKLATASGTSSIASTATTTTVAAVPTSTTTQPTTTTTTTTRPTTTTITTTTTTTTTRPPIAPAAYQGAGGTVLDVRLDASQIVLDATHSGRSNFIVKPVAADGSTGSSIVNEIGNYAGRHLIPNPTKVIALEIKADGPWTFTFDGIGALKTAVVGQPYQSVGDDVLLVSLPASGLVRAAFTASDSNFIVRPYDSKGQSGSSIVNEIAPWQGTVVVKNDTRLLEVTATGVWTMNLS